MGLFAGGNRKFRVVLSDDLPGLSAPVAAAVRTTEQITNGCQKFFNIHKTPTEIMLDARWRGLIVSDTNWLIDFTQLPGDGAHTNDFHVGTWWYGYKPGEYPNAGESYIEQTNSVQWLYRKLPNQLITTVFLNDELPGILPTNGDITDGTQKLRFESHIAPKWNNSPKDNLFTATEAAAHLPIRFVTTAYDDGLTPLAFTLLGTKDRHNHADEMVASFHFTADRCEVVENGRTLISTGYYILCVYGNHITKVLAQVIVNTGTTEAPVNESKLFVVGQMTDKSLGIDPQIPSMWVIYRQGNSMSIRSTMGPMDREVGEGMRYGMGGWTSEMLNTTMAVIGTTSVFGEMTVKTIPGTPVRKSIAVGIAPYLTYCAFKCGYLPYACSGFVSDELVSVNFPIGNDPSDTNPLVVNILANVPAGTSITTQVFTSYGEELTQLYTTDEGRHAYFSLNTTEQFNTYRVVFTLNSFTFGLSSFSPIIYGYSTGISGEFVTVETPLEIILQGWGGKVSDFVPYSEDIDAVKMSYEVTDLSAHAATLKVRPFWRFKFQVSVTDGDAIVSGTTLAEELGFGEWHTLFDGVTTNIDERQLEEGKTRYNISARSFWHLVKTQVTGEARYLFRTDGDTSGVYGRTLNAIITEFLELAGFNSALYVDLVADSSTIFIDSDSPTPAIVNPGKNIGEFLLGMFDTYLRSYFFWDHCLGKWRTIARTAKDALPLFIIGTPKIVGGQKLLPMMIPRYYNLAEIWTGSTTNASTVVPRIPWIHRRSLKTNITPDFNYLIVTAVGNIDGTKALGSAEAVWINPDSANFKIGGQLVELDDSLKGPSWLGRIVPFYYFNPTLNCFSKGDQVGNACKLIARRIGDFAGNGYTRVTEEIPMPLFPHSPEEPTKLRTLRFDDPIRFDPDGDTFLIREINGAWNKSSMSTIAVISERILDRKGIIPA